MNKEIAAIFQEFAAVRPAIEVSLAAMKADIKPFLDKLVLYGAGSAGIAFLHYLEDVGIKPRYFVDGDPAKWGTTVEWLEVIAPDEVVAKVSPEALVIVTINTDGKRYCKSFAEALRRGGHKGVHERLVAAGCRHTIDYTYFRRCHDLFHGDRYNLPSCSDVNLLVEHQEDIAAAYELLADDESRDVFKKILRFRLVDDSIDIPTLPQDEQYFEYNIYRPIADEFFVDCGAFNGITLKKFLANNQNKFSGYVAIEPDGTNFAALEKYVNELPTDIRQKISLEPCAAGEGDGFSKLYKLRGPGSFIAEDIGTDEVPVKAIDDMVRPSERVTMIKMNIEGSELRALRGARRTIAQHKPVLAVAGYHKTWDLWEVPLLVASYTPKYKTALRSYMNHISFVYYFVPEGRYVG